MNILVTGASRGIGAATLALLRNDGHRIVGAVIDINGASFVR